MTAGAALVAGAPITSVSNAADIIPNSWIVVMRNTMSDSEFLAHLSSLDSAISGAIVNKYQMDTFKGYHGTFSQSLLDVLAANTDVAYIEPDVKVRANELTTQSSAPTWGLGRISHRQKGNFNYIYDSSAGSGTYAYVIDTGIRTTHNQFGGRAVFGANFAGDGLDTDGNGHGTHVSGTIGSATYGVSKKTNLIAVKVLDASGSGASSGVIMGIQWAANDMKSKGRVGKAVANLSLGGVFSQATNDAVAAAVDAGLFMGVAAGNDGTPAFLTSPASEPKACTVGATEIDDKQASYSNYGSVVDIFAPGTNITSTWNGSDDDTKSISGTSMATPHIVGLGAYLLTLEGSRTPAALCDRMASLATKGAITNNAVPALLGTKNLLAYNGNGA